MLILWSCTNSQSSDTIQKHTMVRQTDETARYLVEGVKMPDASISTLQEIYATFLEHGLEQVTAWALQAL